MLRSKTLPSSSLRARSLTAPSPHPPPPKKKLAARDLARRLEAPPPNSLPRQLPQ